MSEEFKVATRETLEDSETFDTAWRALRSLKGSLESYELFRSEDGGPWSVYKVPLVSGDYIELTHISDDLAWGVMTWEEQDPHQRIYLFEVHARSEHSPMPTYFREKSTDFVALTQALVKLLTDETHRKALQAQAR